MRIHTQSHLVNAVKGKWVMRYFAFLLLSIFINPKIAYAEIQALALPSGGNFIASMPCTPQKMSVNSGIGVTNALQCRADNGSSVCMFLISEQPLDSQAFSQSGWKFIEEINHQYALQMDKNYQKIYGKLVDSGGLGKAYAYSLIRQQDGMQVDVKGKWLVANGRLLRGTVSCAPKGTSYMKSESELFLNSFSVLSKN